jgi:serine/threonine protein kinase
MQLTCSTCGGRYAAAQAGGLCPRCLAQVAEHPTREPADEHPLVPGQTFRGLEVLDVLARGGMSVVYKARLTKLNRIVALKILPRRLAEEEDFRERFEREAQALAGLSHPNIVGVYDYGIEGDLSFLVMEFVEGVTLRQLLRDNTVTPAQSVAIVLQICDALEFAHRQNVVHRDIKPDNVLLDKNGTVKITDFGLVKILGVEAQTLTESNLVVGTPHYMAPEQLERPREVDHRADLYSVGVVFYEMLTRELPLGRFEPPSRKAAVDARLDDVILTALAKDPEKRYRRAGELRFAVARIANPDAPQDPVRDQPTPRRRFAMNVELQCSCGWVFFVPGNVRGMVRCPSCRAEVSAAFPPPSRRSGGPPAGKAGLSAEAPRAPAPAAAGQPSPDRAPRLLIGACGVLTLLVLALAVLVARGDGRPRETSRTETSGIPLDAADAAPPPAAKKPAPAGKPGSTAGTNPEAAKSADFVDYRRRLDQALERANMAGIVSTILLHTGRVQEHDDLHRRLLEYEREAKDLVTKMTERGDRVGLPDRFLAGDRLTSLSGRNLEAGRAAGFAEDLRAWLSHFRAGSVEKAAVLRGTESVVFTMNFPERSKELAALAHLTGVILGEGNAAVSDSGAASAAKRAPSAAEPDPPPAEPPPPTPEPLPPALLAETAEKLNALHPYYRSILPPEDRDRIQKLFDSARGFPEDVDYLKHRVQGELCARAASEHGGFLARAAELDAKLASGPPAGDVIVFKDGRKIDGTVEEETEVEIKVKVRLGSVRVRRDEILRIERGKGAGLEFRTRFEAARGKKDELQSLLAWCRERNLALQKELVAYTLLALDPGHERARLEEGFVKSSGGAWARETEVRLQEGKIEWNGRWYTPDQLRQSLRSLGYVQVNGLWAERVPKEFRIDNLYRDEGKLLLVPTGSATVVSKIQTERDMQYDIVSKSWVPKTKNVSVARYVGGGTCHVEITAPGDLVDCRVRAKSVCASAGDGVTVAIVTDPADPAPHTLYSMSVPGENTASFDVSDKVRGRTRFYIRAATRGNGMFLAGDSNDLGVLEVRYTYAKPLERLNAVLGLKREPPPPVGVPLVGADPRAHNDSVETTVRTIARSIAIRPQLTDFLEDMRKATETLYYSRELETPPKYAAAVGQIRDPLSPRWDDVPRESLIAAGTWWAGLSAEERREFAHFYGLWCARARFLKRQNP